MTEAAKDSWSVQLRRDVVSNSRKAFAEAVKLDKELK